MPLLTLPEINDLFTATRDHGLRDGTWSAALNSLPPNYHAQNNTPAQLMSSLHALNNSGQLVDGTVPLQAVLFTLQAMAVERSFVSAVKAALAKIEAQLAMTEPVAYAAASGFPEAYTGTSDDILPYRFLHAGSQLGRSVGKVLVPRFEQGERAIDDQGRERSSFGTGWMIGSDLMVTNFHVVCARLSDEADPSPEDLALQIAGTAVLMDYDAADAPGRKVAVHELVCRGGRGGSRDYAVLRLDPSAGLPPPLRMRAQAPSVPKDGYPVNVVQHPAGLEKRIAIRSNLLKSADATRLEYFSDTLGGSSGAPLCNDAWEVIGLHRASGPATNVWIQGKQAAAYNEGIPVRAFVEDLRTNFPEVHAVVSPQVL